MIKNGTSYRAPRPTCHSGVCETCKEVFYSFRTTAMFCTPACQRIGRRGDGHRNWRGGRYVSKDGYVYIAAEYDPVTHKMVRREALEHRLVMAEILGRPLRKGENVHHKNGIRSDNSPANLELWVKAQPHGQRVSDIIECVADRYESEIRAKLEIKDLVRSVIARLATNGTLSVIPNSQPAPLLFNEGVERGL
jgi:predicted amidophosphoribosyltransferase